MSDPIAYPLQWPAGKKRTPADRRICARFGRKEQQTKTWSDGSSYSYSQSKGLTVSLAVQRVLAELGRLGLDHRYPPVISTNLEVRKDGLPRSGQRKPEDPGVAVYFRLDGKPIVLATDVYTNIEDNIAAIAAHIAASRTIERHGVGTLHEIFAGFAALPPAMAPDDWRALLDEPKTHADAESAYREKMKTEHPDVGGSNAKAAALNAAIEKAREFFARGTPR